ncbi:hypothetical protein PpBr36_01754 [Pyricularia pennisetigena]|uniref:hypothetical protein n=1 Tax=Pyricularia pennisetigena TaxID=1578925 RepID=UPI0011512E78|nr:hypothetical protein PpBr36_01754 [Pyricularia pennisetigena]TLS29022.1 hypothetical protein PpBr36_01754 [Pyricularia pennisetigena]
MTSYGGNNFSRTGYNAQGAEDGGGFMGGSQQGSQGGAGGKSYQDECLKPVTIKQLLDVQAPYPDADFVLDGRPITQITLVGQVRSINPQPTNITYRIDDGTGIIDVKRWIDPEKAEDADAASQHQPDSYVRIWGKLKAFNNRRHVGALFVRPVEDFNEVNYHMLEVAYVHLDAVRQSSGGGGGAGAGGEESMFVDNYSAGVGSTASKAANCSISAQRLFNHLQNASGHNEGQEANFIARAINMSVRDVEAAADELLSAGLIYPTVDDHTWAVLDY